MKQKAYLFVAALAIVFSIIAFAVPFSRESGFWIAYLFGMIALGAQFYFFRSAFKGNEPVKSRIYGFPIARIGVIYLGVQLMLSVVQMLLADEMPYWVTLIIDAIVFVLAMAGCIATEAARSEVVRLDANVVRNTTTMESLQLSARSIARLCPEGPLQVRVQQISETLRFSDPVSSERTSDIENSLTSAMNLLRTAIEHQDQSRAFEYADSILQLIQERNDLCRLAK